MTLTETTLANKISASSKTIFRIFAKVSLTKISEDRK